MMLVRSLGVAVLLAAATWFLGWWAVPLGGALYALVRGGKGRVTLEAALGAMVAWGALLGWQASNPAFGRLQQAIGGVFPVPAIVLMLVTVLLAGVLAGAAAQVASPRR